MEIQTGEELANELATATQTVTMQHDHGDSQGGDEAVGIDYSDPVALHAAICRVHPFGEIFLFEGIIEACRRGQGHALLQLMTPGVEPHFDEVSIREILPTIEFIASYGDLHARAEAICRTGFFGTCGTSRRLIEEVADASPLGAMAQSYLNPSVKPKRRRSVRNRQFRGRHRW
jgi:hypothetical protein